MTVARLLDELKTALDNVDGLRCYDHYPSKISPPAAVLSVESVEYHADFDEGLRVTVQVDVIGQRVDARTGQAAMHAYYSSPIKTQVEAGTYTDFDVVCSGAGPVGTVDVAGTPYFAISFTVVAIGAESSGGGGGG